MSQNFWEGSRIAKHRQRRRAELVRSLLKRSGRKTILDIGSAEGFITSFFSDIGDKVCGVEVDLEYIEIAKQRVPGAEFVNASLDHLPFKQSSFDAVCILEVLEHLAADLQSKGLNEVARVVKDKGSLIISIPYKEQIIKTRCIHCSKITPLYGHLHSMDERYIECKFPPNSRFSLVKEYRLPNLHLISCKTFFEPFPLKLWLLVNAILGMAKKGYWTVLYYER